MSKFLNTTATNYYLEELIKGAQERLVLISPFLKFNDRIKELLADKDRMKIDIRLVYGKSELAPQEINWLSGLEFVRTSFCQNLHAKFYANENVAIITSMNLYDFSQVNNNEMGMQIVRSEDPALYSEAFEEAQRLIRVSEQVRLAADTVNEAEVESASAEDNRDSKLSTSKLARSLGMKTAEFTDKLIAGGMLVHDGDKLSLSPKGASAGGELRVSKRFGSYFLWPSDLSI
ncbi:MAG: DNA repair protein [Verrucomicrobiales bacterium]|nr:DNA repair protein [Verrucomicrobiales bacterium]|tara:strand:- start:11161 stop:11856 length:696 start_codon:yes stop_codon:yes gene_type:complete